MLASRDRRARQLATHKHPKVPMTFGLGAALIEQITVKDGVVQETNFHEYRVMRMSDMPPMNVKVISTDNKPTGIGEAGVPVVAPAIANAVTLLTGKRLRHLPMTPDRVKRGLAWRS